MIRFLACFLCSFAALCMGGQRVNLHERAWDRDGVGIRVGNISGFPDDISKRSAERWLFDAFEDKDIPYLTERETNERSGESIPIYSLSFYYNSPSAGDSAGYDKFGVVRVHMGLREYAALRGLGDPVLIESWTSDFAITCHVGDEEERLKLLMKVVAEVLKGLDPDSAQSFTKESAAKAFEKALAAGP